MLNLTMQKSTRLIKIIVFGATGRTGKLVCKRILNSGLLLHYSSWQFLNQMAFFILIAIASIFLFYQKSIRAF